MQVVAQQRQARMDQQKPRPPIRERLLHKTLAQLELTLDITRQEAARLSAALSEARREAEANRLMLQEVDHRAKNSLQLAASMLQLQVTESGNPEVRAHIEAAIRRLQSLAAMHAVLYESGSGAPVDMERWLRRVCDGLDVNPRVQIALDVPEVSWPVEVAGPVGLLTAEAVANALKHAFPGGRGGRIEVSLSGLEGDRWRLQVSDDGCGGEMGEGLGLRLLHLFACQLGGALEVRRGEGGAGAVLATCFSVSRDAP